jgi:predicted transcriptional regulator
LEDLRRSKLEMYLDILKTLAQRGPLKLTHIMYKSNVNCCVLKDYLEFLSQQELVGEKTLRKEKVVYEITEKGLTVLKYFREMQILLPISEEQIGIVPLPLQHRSYSLKPH